MPLPSSAATLRRAPITRCPAASSSLPSTRPISPQPRISIVFFNFLSPPDTKSLLNLSYRPRGCPQGTNHDSNRTSLYRNLGPGAPLRQSRRTLLCLPAHPVGSGQEVGRRTRRGAVRALQVKCAGHTTGRENRRPGTACAGTEQCDQGAGQCRQGSTLQPATHRSHLHRSEEHTSELQSRPHLVC